MLRDFRGRKAIAAIEAIVTSARNAISCGGGRIYALISDSSCGM
jgi:hypothetical protein